MSSQQDPKELFRQGREHLDKGQRLIEEANRLLTDRAERAQQKAGDHHLNKTQAGKYIGISYRQIRRLEQEGELKFIGGKILRSQLDRYLRTRRPRRAHELGIANSRG